MESVQQYVEFGTSHVNATVPAPTLQNRAAASSERSDCRSVLAAGPADAHMGTGLPGGFMSGFIHPLTGFNHMLAMVSVGLWGAYLGQPLIIALPVIFPTVMAFGAFLGIANVPFPPIEIGIGLSVLILGGAIAAACEPRSGRPV